MGDSATLSPGRVQRTCETCGSLFVTFRAWLRGGKSGRFCSAACMHKTVVKRAKTIISAVCRECGAAFSYRKGRGGTGEFCSVPCMAASRGRQMTGAAHPNWKGGMAHRPHSSRIVIKRLIAEIGHCERCGSSDDLQGHHKLSFESHEDLRSARENIEVLCVACHALQHPELAQFILSRAA